MGELDGDRIDDIVLSSPRLDLTGEAAGAAYVLHGPLSTSLLLSPGARWLGEGPDDNAGSVITPAGDVDGDGLDDIVIGAGGADGGAVVSGAADLLLGPASACGSLSGALRALRGRGTTISSQTAAA